jgi:hypothetical protein
VDKYPPNEARKATGYFSKSPLDRFRAVFNPLTEDQAMDHYGMTKKQVIELARQYAVSITRYAIE